MEALDGQVRSVVDTLVKVINALETAGIEIIGENATSNGAGRGVRLKATAAGSQPKRVPSMLYDQAGEPQAETEAIRCAADRVHAETGNGRSEEHTSELQSLIRISYAVFCFKKQTTHYISILKC